MIVSLKILNNIQKDLMLANVERSVAMIKKVKLTVGGLFMIGNYGETPATINETIDFAKKLNLDYALFSIATPYPGTAFHKKVLEEGRMLVKGWGEFNRFRGAIFEWNNLSKKDIDRYYKMAYRSFYLRPAYILKRILGLRIRDLRLISRAVSILANIFRSKGVSD